MRGLRSASRSQAWSDASVVVAAACLSNLLQNLLNDRASLCRYENLASQEIRWQRSNGDQAEAALAFPAAIADGVKIARRAGAMHAQCLRVFVDPFAFLKSDHEERRHEGKRHRPVQIGQRLERP